MTEEESKAKAIELANTNYGRWCTYEKLVIAKTWEHNGLRYDGIIPWSSTEDVFVKVETQITGSIIAELDERVTRGFSLLPDR